MTSDPIQLLIADDSASFRKGLRALFKSTPDIDLLGEAATGTEAVAMAEAHQPDVILMDLQMPEINGIEATRQILHTSPHISILILTMFDDDDSVFAAMQAGARGYLLKGALKNEILRAIYGLSQGEAVFGPAIARRLIDYFAAIKPGPTPYTFPELTQREREILDLIAQHYNNQEIAAQLKLSPKTIRNHASNIFAKLQAADRAQAIIIAQQAGFGKTSKR